jgi:hypothetical protein
MSLFKRKKVEQIICFPKHITIVIDYRIGIFDVAHKHIIIGYSKETGIESKEDIENLLNEVGPGIGPVILTEYNKFLYGLYNVAQELDMSLNQLLEEIIKIIGIVEIKNNGIKQYTNEMHSFLSPKGGTCNMTIRLI